MSVCAASLDLVGNTLSGRIPSEIGLLSSLGKFVIEERMTLYFARVPNCVATFHLVIDLMLSCCFVNYFTEELSLYDNDLVGSLPTEIGQLTKLSEYIHDCFHDVLAQSRWASIHSYPPHDTNGLFCLFVQLILILAVTASREEFLLKLDCYLVSVSLALRKE